MDIQARLKNKRICITGAQGFVGSYLLDKLRSLSLPVIALKGDVCSAETWKGDFDLLFHLAAALPKQFDSSPVQAYSVNINGVLLALESCRKRNARMVFVSTCGVYQPDTSGFFSEDSPLSPQGAYAQSKLMGEMLCRSYADHYGVKTTVLRLFNIYGAGQGRDFIIPYLVRCGLEGAIADIKHPGSYRDFIYITDFLDLLLRAASVDLSLFSVFNAGSGITHPIKKIVELMGAILGGPVRFRQTDSAPDVYPVSRADIQRAVKTLDWSPKVSLEEGIGDIVNKSSR